MSSRTTYRLLEIIPGSLVWATFVLAIGLSFIKPIAVVYFIIIFDLYWLTRVVYFVTYLIISWRRYRACVQIDWMQSLKDDFDNWQKIWHIVFLPTYKEKPEIIEATFQSLITAKYPKEKFIVVLAGEERDKENFEKMAGDIKNKYGDKFGHFLTTIHPKNLPNEIPGKGSNLNWSGRKVKEYIDKLNISYEDIIVSAFDIDSCPHEQYFTYLTHTFLKHPARHHTSYQPVALYNNNIWSSPSLVRVASMGTTFWLLTELPRPDRLFTFSSHSMSWQALVDCGFWQKDIVTEDSRIFLQCYLRYNGNYTVTPLYLPLSMHTVAGETLWQSLKNLYRQQRRWAWGVEHFPYMVWHFWHNKKIALRKKIKYIWNLGEGMYSWATAPLLIFILGRLPLYGLELQGKTNILTQTAPVILKWLLTIAMVGIFLSVVLSLLLLPPRPKTEPRYKFLIMILQWMLLPLTINIFGAIPAAEAQTRLMLGKYLGFHVSEKR